MATITELFQYAFGLGGDALGSAEWVELSWEATNGRITAIKPLKMLPYESQAVDAARDLAITPAFVNAHTHIDLGAGSPIELREHEDMVDWLLRVVKTRKRSTDESQQDVKDALIALRSTGTGIIADVSQNPRVIHTMAEYGMGGNVAMEFFHPALWSPNENSPFWDRTQPLWDHFTHAIEQFGHEALTLGLSPHSPYNVSKSAWQALLEHLQPPFVHAHMAEFDEEIRYLNAQESRIHHLHETLLGRRFIPESTLDAYLDTALWSPRGLFVHGAELTQNDALKLNGINRLSLVSCPRSNLHLHGKTITTEILKTLRNPVILGTDSALSCPSLDIRDEARAFCAQHHWDWEPSKVLHKITLDAATALGLGDDLGSLAVGKLAHFSVWDVFEMNNKSSILKAILDSKCTPQIHKRVAFGKDV
jgi:aminodeoxyfutalosine deaminase